MTLCKLTPRAARLLFFALLSLCSTLSYAGVITIQAIQIRESDGTGGAAVTYSETLLNSIWSQAGISLNFLAPSTYDNSDFLTLSLNDATFESPLELLTQDHGQNPDPLVLNLFFAQTLAGAPSLGLALQNGNSSVMFADTLAGLSDEQINKGIAHMIAHNLGLEHFDPLSDDDNLMALRNGTELNDVQIALANTSRFVRPDPNIVDDSTADVPEPWPVLLFAPGLLALAFTRRAKLRA